MKNLRCSFLVILLATGSYSSAFAEEDCASAVDAADSMNVNQKECDYSEKGLNGFLQKAFKKGSEGAVLSTSADTSNMPAVSTAKGEANGAVNSVANKTDVTNQRLSTEVDQWASIALAKNQMLPKIMEACGKSFQLFNETYRLLPMGRIELTLEYRCL